MKKMKKKEKKKEKEKEKKKHKETSWELGQKRRRISIIS